jgi:hypothetical protein
MGITCSMVRPNVRFMYWHQSTMARPLQVAIRLAQHKRPLGVRAHDVTGELESAEGSADRCLCALLD